MIFVKNKLVNFMCCCIAYNEFFISLYIGNVTFTIPNDVASNKFVIASNGLVTLRDTLDREKVARYSVSILARSSKLLDITTLEVIVMDENDNSPEFRPGSCYTLAVPENQETSAIHTVAATDLDEEKNGEIFYSIVGELFCWMHLKIANIRI